MNESLLPGASDTIVAQATAGARSALAVIRMSGPDAHAIGATVLTPWHTTPRRAFLATLRDPEQMERKSISGIITIFRAPASFTGEDMVELSLHGGEIGPSLAINALLCVRCTSGTSGRIHTSRTAEWKARSPAGGSHSRSRRLSFARNARSSHSANSPDICPLDSTRSAHEIIELEALLAYDVDFPEEDDGPIAAARIEDGARDVLATIDTLLATTCNR